MKKYYEVFGHHFNSKPRPLTHNRWDTHREALKEIEIMFTLEKWEEYTLYVVEVYRPK